MHIIFDILGGVTIALGVFQFYYQRIVQRIDKLNVTDENFKRAGILNVKIATNNPFNAIVEELKKKEIHI